MLIRRRTLLGAAASLAASRAAWADPLSPALVAAAKQEGAISFYTSVDVIKQRYAQVFGV